MLFKKLLSKIPSAQFAVAGLGKTTKFPAWIEDHRVDILKTTLIKNSTSFTLRVV
jgi:hypothetical protein